MHRLPFAAWSLAAAATAVLAAACGGGSSTTPTASQSSSSAATASASFSSSGGSFCSQVQSDAAQLTQIDKGVVVSPGAVPTVQTYKTLIGNVDQAIDSLAGSVPGDISTDFGTIRTAYDQLNSQVQSATTLQQIIGDFQVFSTPTLKTASTNVGNYFKNTCHVGA